jgi:hypothetical protein
MTIRIITGRACALVAALACATACAKKDSSANATVNAAGSSATTAGSGGMTAAQNEDFHQAMAGYQLTDDNVNKATQALQKLSDLRKSNPQLAASLDANKPGDDAKTIDEVASRMDAIPPAHAILSNVGISSRDFVLTLFAAMESGAA